MPAYIRFVGIIGNGAAAILCTFIVLVSLVKGHGGAVLFFMPVVALTAFNVHVIWKSANLLSEEELLKAEIRKAELRKQLAGYGKYASEPDSQPTAQ